MIPINAIPITRFQFGRQPQNILAGGLEIGGYLPQRRISFLRRLGYLRIKRSDSRAQLFDQLITLFVFRAFQDAAQIVFVGLQDFSNPIRGRFSRASAYWPRRF